MQAERELAKKLAHLIQSSQADSLDAISSLKKVYIEPHAKKKFEGILKEYLNDVAPKFMANPDLVLVFEDSNRIVDEYVLVAIELKHFKSSKNKDKDLRRGFREVGQPLRYLVFGFDSVVLWHVFAENIDDDEIRSYSELVSEVVEKLELPMTYFSTKMLSNNNFKVYKPLNLDMECSITYLIQWMGNICRDARNLLILDDQRVFNRRRALKVVLSIP